MKTLTYLVPNDMRREPERPIAIRPVVNVESASFGVATIGVPALDGVPVDVVRSDMTAEMLAAAARAEERARYPLRLVQFDPPKRSPEEERRLRERIELLREILTDSVIDLPSGCEVEYLEAAEDEQPGTWALGPVHDETKPTG